MAEVTDVVITSRVPVGEFWMVSGYGTVDSDCYVSKNILGFAKVRHAVFVNGRSTTVTQNTTGVIINSNAGTENDDNGSVWFTNSTGLVADFCVIGR